MKYRERKPTDDEMVEEAYRLIIDLIMKNQKKIEPTLWVGAMIAALADNFEDSEIPFEYFKQFLIEAAEHYKY